MEKKDESLIVSTRISRIKTIVIIISVTFVILLAASTIVLAILYKSKKSDYDDLKTDYKNINNQYQNQNSSINDVFKNVHDLIANTTMPTTQIKKEDYQDIKQKFEVMKNFSDGTYDYISQELITACIERGLNSIDGKFDGEDLRRGFLCNTYDVFIKGDIPDHEEYGAFCNCGNETDGIISLSNFSEDSMSYVNPDNDIVICGIAGDYCVLETLKNLIDIPELKGQFMVFEDGVASIDGGENLKNFMSENNIAAYV